MANGLGRARPRQRSATAAIWALSRATPRLSDFPPFAASPRPSVALCFSANRRLTSSDMTPDIGHRRDVGACNIPCQRVSAFGGAKIVGNSDDVCLQQSSDLFARLRLPVSALIGMIAAHIGIHDGQENWRAVRSVVTHNGALVLAEVQPRRCSEPEHPPSSCGPRRRSLKPCRCEPRSRSERSSSKDSNQGAGIPEPIPRVENQGRTPASPHRAALRAVGSALPWHRRGCAIFVRLQSAAQGTSPTDSLSFPGSRR